MGGEQTCTNIINVLIFQWLGTGKESVVFGPETRHALTIAHSWFFLIWLTTVYHYSLASSDITLVRKGNMQSNACTMQAGECIWFFT